MAIRKTHGTHSSQHMRYLNYIAYFFFTVSLSIAACNSDDSLTPAVDTYAFVQPAHFPSPTYDLANEPITKAGFELGKKLFGELRLSRTNDVACENCHAQTTAFADPQHALSIGVENRIGTRNAPHLANMAFIKEFLWDGGISHLDFVPTNAITAFHEMDLKLEEAVARLNSFPEYQPLFEEAFGADTVTSAFMLKAFSQYTLRLVSANSKYDKYILGLEGGNFSEAELRGLDAFRQNCSSCHAGELFTDQSYRNNGLDSTFRDLGRAAITEIPEDEGKFRVPSLRNVERTAPYMHDGRFNSVDEVLMHYRSGVTASANLDPILSNGITLTEEEVEDLKAFLLTLTDWDFLREKLF